MTGTVGVMVGVVSLDVSNFIFTELPSPRSFLFLLTRLETVYDNGKDFVLDFAAN
jgi:hypothetical protein